MTNLVYVNWQERTVVVNPDSWIKEKAKEIAEDTDEFEAYLGNFTNVDLFNMNADERKETWDTWMEQCMDDASAEFDHEFDEYNLDDITEEEEKNMED